MRWSDVVTLTLETSETGRNGFPVVIEGKGRKVFANMKSVGSTEYAISHQAGIKADLLFDVRTAEYHGETLLEHGGNRYRIYKTFISKNGEVTELKVTDLSTGT